MTPTEAMAALDALRSSCLRCGKHHYEVIRAVADRRRTAHRAAQDRRGRDWSALLAHAERELATQMEWAEAHLREPHEAPAQRPTKPPAEPASVDTRPECPRCGTRVDVKPDGRIRLHNGPSGARCARRQMSVAIDLPPVSIPKRGRPAQVPTNKSEPSRLDAGSECEDCGRWLPGERQVCGRCFVHRSTA